MKGAQPEKLNLTHSQGERTMKKTVLWIVCAGLLSTCNGLQAAAIGISPKIGTLGYGGDLTVNLGSILNLRLGYNTYNLDYDVDMDEADVDGTLELETIPILLDIHPGGGAFRISLGVIRNNNEISISADPTEPLEREGTPDAINRLNGTDTFDETSYYI